MDTGKMLDMGMGNSRIKTTLTFRTYEDLADGPFVLTHWNLPYAPPLELPPPEAVSRDEHGEFTYVFMVDPEMARQAWAIVRGELP